MDVGNDDSDHPGTAFGTIVDGVAGLTANLLVADGGTTFGTVVNFNGVEDVEGEDLDHDGSAPGTRRPSARLRGWYCFQYSR
jgi:hypothetical protein